MRSPRGSRRPASLRFHAEELPLEQLFSEHELLLLRKRFAKMCENAGGTVRNGLTREGFRTFTGVLGLSHELSDRMFHSFDRDNDDTISVTEYIRGINVMTKGNKEQRIRFAFDMFDENELRRRCRLLRLDDGGTRGELCTRLKEHFGATVVPTAAAIATASAATLAALGGLDDDDDSDDEFYMPRPEDDESDDEDDEELFRDAEGEWRRARAKHRRA